MPHCNVGTENSAAVEIYYEDHGTEDQILPIAATADRLPGLIADMRVVRVEGGPHNIGWTYPEEVNRALFEFLAEPTRAGAAEDRAAA